MLLTGQSGRVAALQDAWEGLNSNRKSNSNSNNNSNSNSTSISTSNSNSNSNSHSHSNSNSIVELGRSGRAFRSASEEHRLLLKLWHGTSVY